MYVGLVHIHGLETGIRVAAGQDLLIELENLMQVRHGVFEQRQELWQAEMGHLRGNGTKHNVRDGNSAYFKMSKRTNEKG